MAPLAELTRGEGLSRLMEADTEQGGTRVTREELYARVWSTPLRTLAKGYGISDVGLGKICERLNIPRPGQGYWARVAVGKRGRQPPLPPAAAQPRRLPPHADEVPHWRHA